MPPTCLLTRICTSYLVRKHSRHFSRSGIADEIRDDFLNLKENWGLSSLTAPFIAPHK
jgi:hypothetical protein